MIYSVDYTRLLLSIEYESIYLAIRGEFVAALGQPLE